MKKGQVVKVEDNAWEIKMNFESSFAKVIEKLGQDKLGQYLGGWKVLKTDKDRFLIVEKIEEAQIIDLPPATNAQ